MSMLWAQFHYIELDEWCRQNDIAFRTLLSHGPLGYQHLTEADKALLRSRLCRSHNQKNASPRLCSFLDKQQIKCPGSERIIVQKKSFLNCELTPNATILAAKRDKVTQIIAIRMEQVRLNGTTVHVLSANDRLVSGTDAESATISPDIRAIVDKQLSGSLSD